MDRKRMDKRKWPDIIPLAGIFTLALAVRLIPLGKLITPERRFFFGTDPYDHMRRVHLILEDFPHLPTHNFYQGFPEGTPLFLSPLFDFMIALVAKLAGLAGDPSRETVEIVGMVLPAVLGALGVMAVYLLAREFMAGRAALIGAFVFAVLPGYLMYSFAGLPDNNVVEPALAALYFYFLIKALKEGGKIRHALYAGAMGAASILMWRGSTIFWAVAAGAVAVHLLLVNRDRELFKSALWAGAVVFIIQGAALLSMAKLNIFAVRDIMSFREVSAFHGLFSLTIGGAFVLALAAAAYTRRYRISALCALLAAPALALLFIPSMRAELMEAFSMMGQGNEWLRDNLEYRPILYPESEGALSFLHPALRLSVIFWALPSGAVWFVIRAIRNPSERARMSVLAVGTAVFFASTLSHMRFENLLAVFVAILTGLIIEAFVMGQRNTLIKVAVSAALIAAFVPVAMPLYKYTAGRFRLIEVQREFFEAMDWIRENTPPTSHYMDPKRRPEYGVLAEWSVGTWIENVAERPTLATNFGAETYGLYESIRFLLSEDEPSAVDVLTRNRVRYVIVTNLIPSLGNYARIIGLNEDLYARLVMPKEGGKAQWVPGTRYFQLVTTSLLLKDGTPVRPPLVKLRRFRLLFESSFKLNAVGLKEPLSKIKVFEFVKGARLGGRAGPGETVTIRLKLLTNMDRTFIYSDETRAGEDGKFELTLPYSTEVVGNRTSASGPYVVSVGERTIELDVSEESVINGLAVALSG